ncbi:MAG: hypothetical protein mread185_000393 [Mycoplasmataceae bacterium]|nr:MAG: hypothetical protein mread185_000393 [Mycoplasmataceae bacterium]
MSKPRKQHQIIGNIDYAWLNYSRSPQYKNQPFYCLDITEQTQFNTVKQTVYGFANLVNESIWKSLETGSFKNKNYLFFCEKRTRGWKMRDWKEIN